MQPMSTELSANEHDLLGNLQRLADSGKLEVPLLPDIAQRVIALSNDTDSSAADLSRLIQGDPTLAAHVMRVANSAAYSPNGSLVSLHQAIARLGMELISQIAVATSIDARLFHTPGHEQRVADIWQHALCTALWAREIARACRLNVEATFLCGLLHSIGRAVTLHNACALAEDPPDARAMSELEAQLHRSLGLRVLRQWNMPQIICEAIEFQDDYENAPRARDQACITNAAARLATCTLFADPKPNSDVAGAAVFADLNLYPEDVAKLLDREAEVRSALEALSK